MEIEYIVGRVTSGNTIQQAVRQALILSRTHLVPIRFAFNGVELIVDSEEEVRRVVERYDQDRQSGERISGTQ